MTATEFNHQLLNLEDTLKGFATRFTTNREEANDLVQETYMRAIVYKGHFLKYPKNIKGWLITIMKNIFINNYNQRKRNINQEDIGLNLFNNQKAKSINDTEHPETSYNINEIYEKIEKLDSKYKEPLKLYLNGYKYHEIADRMNLKIGTVKSRIFYSRLILKNYLYYN